jgi:hypothetical protein
MVAYARFRASDLPKAVGLDWAGGRRRSDGRAGHICHGPYITLGPGQYTAGFYLQRDAADIEGEIELEACAEHGRRVFASRSAPVKDLFSSVAGLVWLDFSVDAVERACEIRLSVPALVRIEVAEAVLFRRDVSDWGLR